MTDPYQQALDNLKDVFGYTEFRSGQDVAVKSLLDGQNLLAVMPTGAGKSLCFQIPALMKAGITIVVSPLLSLMQNQVSILKQYGVAAAAINSSQSRDENVRIWNEVIRGNLKILYMSPERLMTDRMLIALSKIDLAYIAIDEAHCISQWGASFRPDYEALKDLKDHFPDTPISAFTATADPATRTDIADKLFAGDFTLVSTGFDRPNLHITVDLKKDWKKQLFHFLQDKTGQAGIIYCLSRKDTEKTVSFLAAKGIEARAYHAGMASEDRSQAQDWFMTAPGAIICGTIAFGMGIDKSDTRWVFHTSMPATLEAYYQEIGRAGRDGQGASVHMIYSMQDFVLRRRFIENENYADDQKRRVHQRLNALINFCETPGCRRETLLAYFGEKNINCDNCDLCDNPRETMEGTIEAQKALSAIYRTGQVFGVEHIVDILRGINSDKVIKFSHFDLPTFGQGENMTALQWKNILRQLVAVGFLEVDIQGYGGLKITPKGFDLLKGSGEFRYRVDIVHKATKKTKNRPKSSQDYDISPENEDLFLALKKLRLTLAKEQKVPAFAVFTDRSLREMTETKPCDVDEFGDIHGVGKAKIKKYADIFLEEINAFRPA